jgi:hypothetical protein
VEEETSSLKYAAINGTIRTAPVQHSTHESIKNQCWKHQSKISAGSVNSYFKQHQYQCAEYQQPVHRASTCKAFSVYKQSAKCQRPMHTASTTIERNINVNALIVNINA